MIETSDISINSPGASLVAHGGRHLIVASSKKFTEYGGIEGYVSEALSLDPGLLSTTLRDALLERRPE